MTFLTSLGSKFKVFFTISSQSKSSHIGFISGEVIVKFQLAILVNESKNNNNNNSKWFDNERKISILITGTRNQ